jgi:asparagine synthase (glutamine-hydrolysing)
VADYLPNDILAKADRMTMAHGLEIRAPLLEPELADFALCLPDRLKTGLLGQGKRILRMLAARSYGMRLARGDKRGFSIPVHGWLRGPARDLMGDLLSTDSVRQIEVLDPAAVQRAVADHLSGRRSHGFELWGLMVLMAWHRCRLRTAPSVPDIDDREERLWFPAPVTLPTTTG